MTMFAFNDTDNKPAEFSLTDLFEDAADLMLEAGNSDQLAIEEGNLNVYENMDACVATLREHGMNRSSFSALNADGSFAAMLTDISKTTVTVESFDENTSHQQYAEMTIEAMSDKLKNWGTALARFFRGIKDKIVSLFKRFMTTRGRLEAALGKLKEKEKNISDAKPEKFDEKMKVMKQEDCHKILSQIKDDADMLKVDGNHVMKWIEDIAKDPKTGKQKSDELRKAINSQLSNLESTMEKGSAESKTLKALGWDSAKAVDGLHTAITAVKACASLETTSKALSAKLDELAKDAEQAGNLGETKDEEAKAKKASIIAARSAVGMVNKLINKRISYTTSAALTVVKVCNKVSK